MRFAFGSDPAYCTLDDASITGLHVDNIAVSGVLDCTPENDCDVAVAGEVWVDQFYDYWDDGVLMILDQEVMDGKSIWLVIHSMEMFS